MGARSRSHATLPFRARIDTLRDELQREKALVKALESENAALRRQMVAAESLLMRWRMRDEETETA